MKNVFLAVLLLTSCSTQAPSSYPPEHLFDTTVARVYVKTDNAETYGSAVPICHTETVVYFLTCRHVVKRENVKEIQLALFSNAEEYGVVKDVKVLSMCDYLDLAVLEAPKTLPVIYCSLINGSLRTLQPVISISCPLGNDPIYSRGIITIQRELCITTASIAPGSSGGGIFDANTGELVGISTAILAYDGEKHLFGSINIFIPVHDIKKWLKEISLL